MHTKVRESRVAQSLLLTALIIFVVLAGFMLWKALGAVADEVLGESGRVWTTRQDCGDENADVIGYVPGEWVWVNGASFTPGPHAWSIGGQPGEASCDPEEIVAGGTLTATAQGGFCLQAYQVGDEDCGEYTVYVEGAGQNDIYTVSGGAGPQVEVWADCGNIYAGSSSAYEGEWDLAIVGTDANGEAVDIVQKLGGISGPMTFSRTDPGTYGPHAVELTATLSRDKDSVSSQFSSSLTCGPPQGSLTLDVDCAEAHFTGSTESATTVDYTLSSGQEGVQKVGSGVFSFELAWEPPIGGTDVPQEVSVGATLNLTVHDGADVTAEISKTLTCTQQSPEKSVQPSEGIALPDEELAPPDDEPAPASEEAAPVPYTWNSFCQYCPPPYYPAQWYTAPHYGYYSFTYWWVMPNWGWYWGPYLQPGW